MRHLIDTYIEGEQPRKISPFDEMPLLEMIKKTGIAEAIKNMPEGIRKNKDTIAETVENNVRRVIIKEHLNDPAYYDQMSALLNEIVAARKAKAIAYEKYLDRIAELVKKVESPGGEDTPEKISTPGLLALYNNLNKNRDLVLEIDEVVKKTARCLEGYPRP